MIFLLLVKVFSMTVRISQLEAKLRELVQVMAIEQLEDEVQDQEEVLEHDDGK